MIACPLDDGTNLLHGPLGSPQGGLLYDGRGFAGHLYESSCFYRLSFLDLILFEEDLIPVINLVHPFHIPLQNEKTG